MARSATAADRHPKGPPSGVPNRDGFAELPADGSPQVPRAIDCCVDPQWTHKKKARLWAGPSSAMKFGRDAGI